MTRINVVPPSELTRLHLIAEYRELFYVFDKIRAAQLLKKPIPSVAAYTYGNGHVRFFYDKALFLEKRMKALIVEMRSRGYYTRFHPDECFTEGIAAERMNDWTPTPEALELNRQRLKERLNAQN